MTVRFDVFRDTDQDGTTYEYVTSGTDRTNDDTDDDGQPRSEQPGEATFDYLGPLDPATDLIVACVPLRTGQRCATVVNGSGDQGNVRFDSTLFGD